jgi:hypothetical protein
VGGFDYGWVPIDDEGEASMDPKLLPRPLTLCVPRGQGATFAVHGWENDQDSGDPASYQDDFDDRGNDDDVLVGFQREFGADLPEGVQTATSDDLIVRYRVDHQAPFQPPRRCGPPGAKKPTTR